MTEEREHHRLVGVHVCEDDSEAEVIIGFLKASGIDAMESSNLPHSVWPVESDSKVLVHEDDAEEALRLLSEREAASELDDEEGGTEDEEDEEE